MAIWALADLHFSFGVPDKKMGLFGDNWVDHHLKIQKHWENLVSSDDLMLIAGDISWAMKLPDALPDLEWIDAMPGTKVMIRGNHDYWWSSPAKLRQSLPPSVHIVHNDVYRWQGYEIGGARLWDSDFSFNDVIEFRKNPKEKKEKETVDSGKIYDREISRLELSLKGFEGPPEKRIVMTHYPPVDAHLNRSAASDLLEKYKAALCVFGHLHNVRPGALPFGEARGVRYVLTSCDYLDFTPIQVAT